VHRRNGRWSLGEKWYNKKRKSVKTRGHVTEIRESTVGIMTGRGMYYLKILHRSVEHALKKPVCENSWNAIRGGKNDSGGNRKNRGVAR